MSDSNSGSGAENALHEKREPEKPHPSELLEFVSVAPGVGGCLAPTVTFTTTGEDTSTLRSSNTAVQPSHSNDELFSGLAAAIPGYDDLSSSAKAATRAEHKMTFVQGLRLYPKAISWSILLSLTIVMEGYDTNLITSFFAFPVFRRSYGTQVGPQDYQISTTWQTSLIDASTCGEIIGLLFNGSLTERFGYRNTLAGSLIWLAIFVFLAFFAFNIQMLLAQQILCGLSWGIFQTLSTTYAAEVMPVALRAYLTSNVNMCWLLGQISGTGIIRALVHNKSEWSYRIPFGLQWVFIVPLFIGIIFAPESPWWLVRHGRTDEAKRSLMRLTSRNESLTDFNADETVAMMQHTNEVEKFLNAGTSYLDCFKGSDLRRTEIACMVWMTQNLCGSALTQFAPYFYEQAGFNSLNSFNLGVGMYALAIVGNVMAWFWMRIAGRRTLYMVGLSLTLVILLVAGGISTRSDSSAISWVLGSLIILMTFVYDSTIGPVCYTLVAEIPSTRLRVKTVVLARIAYNLVGIVSNIITPKMLNPTAWNWKGKSCFFWAVTTLACLVWCYFRLPEPKGLTYMELDILFSKRAKARKFRQFQVNLASTGYFSLAQPTAPDAAWRGYS